MDDLFLKEKNSVDEDKSKLDAPLGEEIAKTEGVGKKSGKDIFFSVLATFISACAAGAFIGIGGAAYLSAQSKIAGALFFAVGMFAVCFFKFNLFTGKVCYALGNNKYYALRLIIILLGNFAGAFSLAFLINLTRLSSLSAAVSSVVETKLEGGLLSAFVLGILCNALIYVAVEGYASAQSSAVKLCALFLGVSVFVLCGFEHCVANVFYISLAGAWNARSLAFFAVNVAGNAIGGILTRLVSKIALKK